MHTIKTAFAAAAFSLAVGFAHASPSDELKSIIDDHWAWALEQSPVFATSFGVRDYDDRLGDASLEAYERGIAAEQAFADRLDTVDTESLNDVEKLNHRLLRLSLKNDVEAAAFGGKYLAITNRNGPHTFITGLGDRLPFFGKADYESYISRLSDAPRYIDETIETLRAGVEAGWVQPCVAMEGYEKTIRYHIVETASESVMLKPFKTKPAAVSGGDWRRLKKNAVKAIERKTIPAIAAFADFYENEYAPACRKDIGASTFPDGASYYTYRARLYTTTEMTPEEIYALGVLEVARLRAEMQEVIDGVDFDGDFEAFQEFLRTDTQFYAKTAEELMAANAVVAKRADGEMPKLFTKLPAMPYTLKPIPDDVAEGTTTAYYERPAGDGTRAGVYRVNTSLLETRPLFEIEALTLHEAVPGHHHQIALAQELTLPNFRKFGGFTVFTEGWGLYAESLGLDMGFYQDPYSNFGRLSYEMWRACRLVVDTGIHAKGWTRDQAIAYMAENTALSEHNISAEVDRYIAWPGQALAYKIGQLKISELRERASEALGSGFDLRGFHDEVLSDGGVPLSILEAKIDAWIAVNKAH